MYEVVAVAAMNNVARRAVGRNLKALAYSVLIAAVVNSAYMEIVILRALSPGTIVFGGELGHRREIAGLELLLTSVAATRFSLISAFVLCVVLLLVVSPACVWLRGTRYESLAWTVPGGCALGAIAGLALDQTRYPLAVGDIWGMVLTGISAGGFLAFYLTSKLRQPA